MTESLILKQVDQRVMTITMNRPKAKNALTLEMYNAMTEALEEAASSDEIRVVVFKGLEKAFTAGNDLNDFMQNPPVDQDSPVMLFLRALTTFAKPVIASVQGFAIGIGTTMLLHCDLVYCSEDAIFQMPFTKLALVPEAGSSLLLPALMGHRQAAEILFFSERFGPQQAKQWGIVNDVIEGDVDAHADARAIALTKYAPQSIRLTKQLLKESQADLLQSVIAREGSIFADRLRSPELAESISAFFEKREPNYE